MATVLDQADSLLHQQSPSSSVFLPPWTPPSGDICLSCREEAEGEMALDVPTALPVAGSASRLDVGAAVKEHLLKLHDARQPRSVRVAEGGAGPSLVKEMAAVSSSIAISEAKTSPSATRDSSPSRAGQDTDDADPTGSTPHSKPPNDGLPSSSGPFSFPSKDSPRPPLRRGVKRRRPAHDVDGPGTAALACKKRRIRRDLVTSRLSQPFSLPATHILSREDAASGGLGDSNKRFLRLATIVAARRRLTAGFFASQPHGGAAQHYHQQYQYQYHYQQQHQQGNPPGLVARPLPLPHHPTQSSLLRRAATLNRFRLRVRHHAAARGDEGIAGMAASAALLQQSHPLNLVAGARFPSASPSALGGPVAAVVAVRRPPPPPPPRLRSPQRSPDLPPRWWNPPPPQPANRNRDSDRGNDGADTRAAALVRDDDEEDGDGSGDGCAFPHMDDGYRGMYDDEPDDIYADFSVIFGGGAGPVDAERGETPSSDGSDDRRGGGSSKGVVPHGDGAVNPASGRRPREGRDGFGEGEGYEDYMDDLDGIPWLAR